VLAGTIRDDWILCQVTSNRYADSKAIMLDNTNFASGSLRVISYARPAKLFTTNGSLIVSSVGSLTDDGLRRVLEAVIAILHASLPPEPAIQEDLDV